jgi:hypothetical protein
MYSELGDHERARATYEDNLLRARASGNRRIEGVTLHRLGWHALDDGRIEEAVGSITASVGIARELGLMQEVAEDLYAFARARSVQGQAATAARLFAAAEAARERIGAHRSWATEEDATTLAGIRSQLDEPAFAAASEQGRAMTLDEAVELALRPQS